MMILLGPSIPGIVWWKARMCVLLVENVQKLAMLVAQGVMNVRKLGMVVSRKINQSILGGKPNSKGSMEMILAMGMKMDMEIMAMPLVDRGDRQRK